MKTFGQLYRSLESFLDLHLTGLENEERIEALTWYCQGLGLELPDKNVYGIATRLQPDNVESCRQRIQRGIQRSRFSHSDVFGRLQRTVFQHQSGQFSAYAIDDTGVGKKGDSSVGVKRQYSGTLGKIGNCQVIVSMHAVSDHFGVCLGAQLYLPKSWTDKPERLQKAGVPEDIVFKKKPEIALQLLKDAVNRNCPIRPVVADSAYGDSREFREGIAALGLPYSVAISNPILVWPKETEPGQPRRRLRRGISRRLDREPERIDHLAEMLWQENLFRKVTWRTGSKGKLQGKYCAVRIRVAKQRTKDNDDLVWLLFERDESQSSGFKYYLSSMKQTTSLKKLVGLTKCRWHIERDYQDMKQYLGFDKYEGRQWGGLHRHLAMVALVHAFLAINREDFSPGIEFKSVDMGGHPSCPTCGAYALDRPLPNMSPNL